MRDPRARERRRERQEPDDHGAMRGGHVAHRQRREQRKADDHASGDQREPRQCAQPGHGVRVTASTIAASAAATDRAAEADEHGIEFRHGDARRGERQAEARDPEQSPQKAVPTLTRRAGVSRYRCGFIQGHRRLVPRRAHSTACPGRPRRCDCRLRTAITLTAAPLGPGSYFSSAAEHRPSRTCGNSVEHARARHGKREGRQGQLKAIRQRDHPASAPALRAR